MNATYDTNLQASAICWVNNVLEKRGAAHYNVSEVFNRYPCDIQGKYSFLTSKPQMIYDSSIVGANIPSGCYVNGVFKNRGEMGLSIDFLRGQFLLNTNASNVSGSYSAREVNTYFATSSTEQLLFEKQNFVNPKNLPNFERDDVTKQIVPAIYVKTDAGKNEFICFEGMASTKAEIKLVFVSNNSFIFQNVNSLFRDEKERYFPLLSPDQLPFDYLGDLKSGTWNYEELQSNAEPNNLVYIDDVRISTFTSDMNDLIGKNALGSVIYITAELYRFPKLS